jgi:glycosyltransferase involved in cell wall biosynthesis
MKVKDKNLPIVSIIMNCYNGEKYLAESLQSVLNQSYKNWELIFFDNASTDKSKYIFNKFKDQRFKYFFNKKKINLYAARNLAISKTKGDFIAFIDVDDWWEKSNLIRRKLFYLKKKFAFSYSNCYYFFEKNKKKKIFTKNKLPNGHIFNELSKNYLVNLSTVLIRKSFLLKLNYIFNKKYNIIGDFDLILRLSEKYLAHSINEPLVNIRYHDQNFSRLNRDLFYKEYKNWYEKVINLKKYKMKKNFFLLKLKYLEIVKDLVKFKNFKIFIKIINYPFCYNKIKLLLIFFSPRFLHNIFHK